MADQPTFNLVTTKPVHHGRNREILRDHPEIKKLFGNNQLTFLLLILLVSVQFTLAGLFSSLSLGYFFLPIILAYLVGAFISHLLYVIIHEATHDLIFRNKTLNKICLILADVANVIPGSVGFAHYHKKHHSHLGHYQLDLDVAFAYEARLVGNIWWKKALWLALFPFIQIVRSVRISSPELLFSFPFVMNLTTVFVVDYFIIVYWGWCSFLFLAFSMMFGLGLHPLGARWIQEHHTMDANQETASYYGVLNKVALNMGYHNEHHDFPSVPWNNLPKVKNIANEHYSALSSHASWSRLLVKFVFNSDYSLHGRVVRKPTQNLETK